VNKNLAMDAVQLIVKVDLSSFSGFNLNFMLGAIFLTQGMFPHQKLTVIIVLFIDLE
jgi:hypothetical protein